MKNIVNVGIRITRNCNFNCSYCNIQSCKKEDMDINEWKRAIDIVKKFEPSTVTLLGGEPTLYPDIVELVDYIVNEKNIYCTLTTNGLNNDSIIKELINIGISNLGVSVDNVNYMESISPAKCKCGLDLINKYSSSVRMTSYIVLSKKNIDITEKLVESLNYKDVASYFIPLHWGNQNIYDHRVNRNNYSFASEEDYTKFNQTIDKLIKLKEQGYGIKNSKEYLIAAKKYIKDFSWKCDGISELRIDSDGKLSCCCDIIGENSSKYSIFDLDEQQLNFMEARNKDIIRCTGCLWPSAFESQNIAKRSRR